MKKIKLLTAFLAVIFVVTSSYQTKTGARTATQHNFEFTGYDMMEPTDWTLVQTPEPTCNFAGGSLCYIKTEKDSYYPHPTSESLIFLSNNSSGFTQPYTGTYGKVRLKP
jgi:hypothetical protein